MNNGLFIPLTPRAVILPEFDAKGDICYAQLAIYEELHRERIRAHNIHDKAGKSMERRAFDDPLWLPVLTEETGEVARVLCEWDRRPVRSRLREELVQVGAMAVAWIDAIDYSAPVPTSARVWPGELPR